MDADRVKPFVSEAESTMSMLEKTPVSLIIELHYYWMLETRVENRFSTITGWFLSVNAASGYSSFKKKIVLLWLLS